MRSLSVLRDIDRVEKFVRLFPFPASLFPLLQPRLPPPPAAELARLDKCGSKAKMAALTEASPSPNSGNDLTGGDLRGPMAGQDTHSRRDRTTPSTDCIQWHRCGKCQGVAVQMPLSSSTSWMPRYLLESISSNCWSGLRGSWG